jgi:release factor glutamine methyltransferase
MDTRGSLIAETAAALSAAGFEDPRRHARRLVAEALAIPQLDLFSHPDRAVDQQQIERVQAMLGCLVAGEPLSRILGRREFWGLEFILAADTLDPRPESETIVEAVLRRTPDRRAPLHLLDLGTGTGCLLLALLHELRAAGGVGIDIAEGAVRAAARNAVLLGLADRARFFVGDWVAAVSGRFDVVIANPPYITSEALPLLPREVACYDPWRAIDGGEDGLRSYRTIAQAVPKLLFPDGMMVTEIGAGQADAVTAMIKANGLVVDGIEKDLAGIARCVVARPPAELPKAEKGWNAPRSRLGWHCSELGAAAEGGNTT